MMMGLHPPHISGGFYKASHGNLIDAIDPIPSPAFPFCYYQDKTDSKGRPFGPYGDNYCEDFQPTFNENGLCYTYNNHELGMIAFEGADADHRAERSFQVRKVKGCGKKKGFTLIVDNHDTFNAYTPGVGRLKGFKVFVTVPGVVTHKVPFPIDVQFNGEYSLLHHGIHYIDSSVDFEIWNADKQVKHYFY